MSSAKHWFHEDTKIIQKLFSHDSSARHLTNCDHLKRKPILLKIFQFYYKTRAREKKRSKQAKKKNETNKKKQTTEENYNQNIKPTFAMCWETFGISNSFALLVVSKCLFIIVHLFVAFASLLLSSTSVCDNNSSQCKLIAVICNSWIFFMRKYSIHSFIHVTFFSPHNTCTRIVV